MASRQYSVAIVSKAFRQYISTHKNASKMCIYVQVHGKQTVQRSHRFKSLSPVMLLNINRIDFDPERCEPVKLNNRFEFPEECEHVYMHMCICVCSSTTCVFVRVCG